MDALGHRAQGLACEEQAAQDRQDQEGEASGGHSPVELRQRGLRLGQGQGQVERAAGLPMDRQFLSQDPESLSAVLQLDGVRPGAYGDRGHPIGKLLAHLRLRRHEYHSGSANDQDESFILVGHHLTTDLVMQGLLAVRSRVAGQVDHLHALSLERGVGPGFQHGT